MWIYLKLIFIVTCVTEMQYLFMYISILVNLIILLYKLYCLKGPARI